MNDEAFGSLRRENDDLRRRISALEASALRPTPIARSGEVPRLPDALSKIAPMGSAEMVQPQADWASVIGDRGLTRMNQTMAEGGGDDEVARHQHSREAPRPIGPPRTRAHEAQVAATDRIARGFENGEPNDAA